ncbi:serine/threonine-protein kinase [Streptomyces sp. NPDC052236]|uniref:serine/threonine-protein kinase n=1 Tax=Streptomyces sp. NPDC052236 TaxID=3365686 RepID=UPI0037D157FD
MTSGENERLAGRYRVIEQLGRGGMGVVWRAFDEVLGREVAVKELRTYTDSSGPELADLRVRMQREARAAARVRHPGVIAVHDVTEHDGRPVIVMELIDGPSLDGVVSEHGVMEPREVAAIGAKVMEALAAAHRVGVLHRDVKPGNVLLDRDGRVVLTDFGIATMEDPGDGSATRLTRSGELVGSLEYLSPERAQGGEPGPASDVWALGATLYAAVEGAAPFFRQSTWSTITAIVVDPLPEPRRGGALGPVLRRLMEKDPARRPDAETAARMLAAVAEGEETGAETVTLGSVRPSASSAPPAKPEPAVPEPSAPKSALEAKGLTPVAARTAPPADPDPDPDPAPAPTLASAQRRTKVLAAAVAVLLVGGGVTYVLVDGDEPGSREVAGGRDGASPGAAGDPGATGKAVAGPSDGTKGHGANPTAEGDRGPVTITPSTTPAAPGGGAGGTVAGGGTGLPAAPGGSATAGGGPATGGPTGGATTGAGTPGGASEPTAVCNSIGGGKYNCTVWKKATSYTASGAEKGLLNKGVNYFYCQQNLGRRLTHGNRTNVWWAKTDDDSGNTNVFISNVYIDGSENDQPVPGLPVC